MFAAGFSPPWYVGGRSDANRSGSTIGRGTNSGSYMSIWNVIGRPATSPTFTFVQSSSVVFSTVAQPWMRAAPLSSTVSR